MRFELISVFAAVSAAAVLPSSSTAPAPAPAVSKGFRIPSTHTSGSYMVKFDANGQAVHTKLTDKPPVSINRKRNSLSTLGRRDDLQPTGCAGLGECNPNDVNDAAGKLGAQCDDINNAVGGGASFYSISGQVAFYFCNFSDAAQQCSSVLVGHANSIIEDGSCGESDNQGGWFNTPAGGSYGYQLADQGFCGHGTSG